MGTDPVHETLRALTKRLDELNIPYAVAGAIALGAHGHVRATTDVDLLVTRTGVQLIHRKLDGLGYVPPFAGSKNLRDTQTGVRIKFLLAGDYPGDGKPKPIAFPDPKDAAVVIDGIRCVKLETFIELKLASGMSNPNRLKDIADIQEFIRVVRPPRALGERLHEYVRSKFYELWDGMQTEPLDR